MATPQTGIFALGTMSHAYLEFDRRAGADPRELIQAVASLREPRTTIGGVNLVAGFRPELWAAVAPESAPAGLHGFNKPLVGPDGYTMPATQHDVVVWLSGAAYDVVFDVSRGVATSLATQATVAMEMVGWPYHRDRDLTGFEDGLENPTLAEASKLVSIHQDAPGAGGSVLLLQQWEHDAARWEALTVDQQERAMGRTKLTGDELDPRPETSHVASTDQDRFGRIFRRNIGYGSLGRHGTMFVGFSRDRDRLDAMLASMAGIGGGQRDELTKFTQPLTGAYYLVPSSEDLAAFSDPA